MPTRCKRDRFSVVARVAREQRRGNPLLLNELPELYPHRRAARAAFPGRSVARQRAPGGRLGFTSLKAMLNLISGSAVRLSAG